MYKPQMTRGRPRKSIDLQQLRDMLEVRGVSQVQAAEELGVGLSTIKRRISAHNKAHPQDKFTPQKIDRTEINSTPENLEIVRDVLVRKFHVHCERFEKGAYPEFSSDYVYAAFKDAADACLSRFDDTRGSLENYLSKSLDGTAYKLNNEFKFKVINNREEQIKYYQIHEDVIYSGDELESHQHEGIDSTQVARTTNQVQGCSHKKDYAVKTHDDCDLKFSATHRGDEPIVLYAMSQNKNIRRCRDCDTHFLIQTLEDTMKSHVRTEGRRKICLCPWCDSVSIENIRNTHKTGKIVSARKAEVQKYKDRIWKSAPVFNARVDPRANYDRGGKDLSAALQQTEDQEALH